MILPSLTSTLPLVVALTPLSSLALADTSPPTLRETTVGAVRGTVVAESCSGRIRLGMLGIGTRALLQGGGASTTTEAMRRSAARAAAIRGSGLPRQWRGDDLLLNGLSSSPTGGFTGTCTTARPIGTSSGSIRRTLCAADLASMTSVDKGLNGMLNLRVTVATSSANYVIVTPLDLLVGTGGECDLLRLDGANRMQTALLTLMAVTGVGVPQVSMVAGT